MNNQFQNRPDLPVRQDNDRERLNTFLSTNGNGYSIYIPIFNTTLPGWLHGLVMHTIAQFLEIFNNPFLSDPADYFDYNIPRPPHYDFIIDLPAVQQALRTDYNLNIPDNLVQTIGEEMLRLTQTDIDLVNSWYVARFTPFVPILSNNPSDRIFHRPLTTHTSSPPPITDPQQFDFDPTNFLHVETERRLMRQVLNLGDTRGDSPIANGHLPRISSPPPDPSLTLEDRTELLRTNLNSPPNSPQTIDPRVLLPPNIQDPTEIPALPELLGSYHFPSDDDPIKPTSQTSSSPSGPSFNPPSPPPQPQPQPQPPSRRRPQPQPQPQPQRRPQRQNPNRIHIGPNGITLPIAANLPNRPVTLPANHTPQQLDYFRSIWTPGAHLPDTIHGHIWPCPLCGRTIRAKRDLAFHYKNQHPTELRNGQVHVNKLFPRRAVWNNTGNAWEFLDNNGNVITGDDRSGN